MDDLVRRSRSATILPTHRTARSRVVHEACRAAFARLLDLHANAWIKRGAGKPTCCARRPAASGSRARQPRKNRVPRRGSHRCPLGMDPRRRGMDRHRHLHRRSQRQNAGMDQQVPARDRLADITPTRPEAWPPQCSKRKIPPSGACAQAVMATSRTGMTFCQGAKNNHDPTPEQDQ